MRDRPVHPDARDLFFRYDGSRFYMSRDGVEHTYESYAVPADVEAAWLGELTDGSLATLAKAQDNRALRFLFNHLDTSHIVTVLRAEPAGTFLDRLVYLELLVKYLDRCSVEQLAAANVEEALRAVIDGARRLAHQAPTDEMQRRIDAVVPRLEHHAPMNRP